MTWTPHHDYTAMSGQSRPMDQNHNVPGDTPCVCGGIAWYHSKDGCDDCAECTGFIALSPVISWADLESTVDELRVDVSGATY